VQVYDIADFMKLLSHVNKTLTTGESLKLTTIRFQMSEKETMEYVTNYVRVDEMSRAHVKPGQEWKINPRPDRPAVAWNIDQKALEVRIEEEKPKAEENRTQEIFVVFAAMRQGTWLPIFQNRLPKEEKGKAKEKAKAKARGKEKVDGNREEEEKEK
jgi:hypothetical protein